jgi:hypothetical protein
LRSDNSFEREKNELNYYGIRQIFPNKATYVILSSTALLIFIGFVAMYAIISILKGICSPNPNDRWCVICRMAFVVVHNISYVADPSLQIFWLWVAPQAITLFVLVAMHIVTKPALDLEMYLYIGSDFLFFQFYIYLLVKHYFKGPVSSSMVITMPPAMAFYFLLINVLHRRSNLRMIGKKAFYTNREMIFYLNKAITDKDDFNYPLYMYLLTINTQCFANKLDSSDNFPTSYIKTYYNSDPGQSNHKKMMPLANINSAAISSKQKLSLALLTIMLTGNIYKALYMLKEIISRSPNCLHKIEAYYIVHIIGCKIVDHFQHKNINSLD